MDEPVRALFMGEGLVLTAVSSTWSSTTYEEAPLGVPVTEAWIEEAWRPVRTLMLKVFHSGEAASVVIPGGVIAVSPYWKQGRVAGVVTRHQLVAPTPSRRSGELLPVLAVPPTP